MNAKFAVAAAAAFWLLPASLAAAAVPELPSAQQPDDDDALARFQAALAEMRTVLLRPGERVEGWDAGGADPDSELRARGADRHYYLTSGGESGTMVDILTDRPIMDFAPAGWQVVDSYGSGSGASGSTVVSFQAISPRYVMGVRSRFRRVNTVDCFDDTAHALLFEVAGTPAGEDDDVAPMMFRMAILALEGQTICVRTDGDAERGYRTRFFLPDGRSLPEMTDPNEVTRIVPAAPIDQLIEPPPPAPEPGEGPIVS